MTPEPLPATVTVTAELVRDREPTETGLIWVKIRMDSGASQYIAVPARTLSRVIKP